MTGLQRTLSGWVVALAAGWWLPTAWSALPALPAHYPQELAALHRKAAAGDLQAQFDLAIVLLCGTLVPRDPAAAASWLARAAPRGHSGAQSVLGWQLMTATGVPRDDRQAARWLREAAEAGDTAAQNNLGVLYALGNGVPRDPALAERWFRAAADKGADEAARNLAVLRGERADDPAGRRAATAPAVHPAVSSVACRTLAQTISR